MGTKEIYVGATGNWKYKWKHIHSIDENNKNNFLFQTDTYTRVEFINGISDITSLGTKNTNWMDFVMKRWNATLEKREKKSSKKMSYAAVVRRELLRQKKKKGKRRKIYGPKSNSTATNYVQPKLAETEWTDYEDNDDDNEKSDSEKEEEDTPPILREEKVVNNNDDENKSKNNDDGDDDNDSVVIDHNESEDDNEDDDDKTKEDYSSDSSKDTTIVTRSKKNKIQKKTDDDDDDKKKDKPKDDSTSVADTAKDTATIITRFKKKKYGKEDNNDKKKDDDTTAAVTAKESTIVTRSRKTRIRKKMDSEDNDDVNKKDKKKDDSTTAADTTKGTNTIVTRSRKKRIDTTKGTNTIVTRSRKKRIRKNQYETDDDDSDDDIFSKNKKNEMATLTSKQNIVTPGKKDIFDFRSDGEDEEENNDDSEKDENEKKSWKNDIFNFESEGDEEEDDEDDDKKSEPKPSQKKISAFLSSPKIVTPRKKDIESDDDDDDGKEKDDDDDKKSEQKPQKKISSFFSPKVTVSPFFAPRVSSSIKKKPITEKEESFRIIKEPSRIAKEPSTPLKGNNQTWIESRPSSQQSRLSTPTPVPLVEVVRTINETTNSKIFLDHHFDAADDDQKRNRKRRKFKQLHPFPRLNIDISITNESKVDSEESRITPTSVADRALAVSTPKTSNKRSKVSPSTKQQQQPRSNDDEEGIKKWRGLKNLGNTCYLNSSLQLLYTLPEFVSGLTGNGSVLCESITSLSNTLKNTTSVTTKTTMHQTAVNPRCIKEAVDAVSDRFLGNEQRDAHEFLSDLIDRLHDELKEKDKDRKKKLVTDRFFRTDMDVCLKCNNCGYERTMQEMYRHLSIEVDRHDRYPTEEEEIRKWKVEDGLKKFFDPQQLDVTCEKCKEGTTATQTQDGLKKFFDPQQLDVTCEKCKEGTTATQTLSIASFPKALILQLKRFVVRERKTETGPGQPPSIEMIISKNKDPVLVPPKINLARFDNSVQKQQQKNIQYKLAGIVHHHGSTPSSGHYTADVIRKNEWISFDDWRTSSIQLGQLLEDPADQRTSYLLLYTMENRSSKQ
eukprot:CAMPEP_0194195056 /NCGR_PEP_ID=MMETSP0154-20130528/75919_1 /TAXON_ID=1049557 /ORGANISM="Thalassiothrix antarctica, Strain L6-D1" /LENGTH=1062 /DNA_ID=CAMNT_0038919543 /DNA_START=418 /DNA_END=3603 /DNA_ORIENTATION=-